MTRSVTRAGATGVELARMLATLAWIVGASAVTLGVLGSVPAWIAGETRGVHRVATVDEAERRLHARVLVPGYFPERLAWPPSDIRVAGGRGGSVALTISARGGGPALQLVEAVTEGQAIDPALLEGRTVLRTSRTSVAGRPAALSSVIVDGETWTELAWDVGGRAVVLRSRGEVDELFRIAHSAHRHAGGLR